MADTFGLGECVLMRLWKGAGRYRMAILKP
jgi:hypothetical protein